MYILGVKIPHLAIVSGTIPHDTQYMANKRGILRDERRLIRALLAPKVINDAYVESRRDKDGQESYNKLLFLHLVIHLIFDLSRANDHDTKSQKRGMKFVKKVTVGKANRALRNFQQLATSY